jgi:hypothetical protein
MLLAMNKLVLPEKWSVFMKGGKAGTIFNNNPVIYILYST